MYSAPGNSPVKKYKKVLFDRMREVKYVIYSNRNLDKKAMLREVRKYYINREDLLPLPGSKINIIADD